VGRAFRLGVGARPSFTARVAYLAEDRGGRLVCPRQLVSHPVMKEVEENARGAADMDEFGTS
jgi:hypothetical protein